MLLILYFCLLSSAIYAIEECGGKRREQMVEFEYLPDREFNEILKRPIHSSEKTRILRFTEPMTSGTSAKLFIGYNGTRNEPFSATKCVAVREATVREINSLTIIRAIYANSKEEHRRHIVNIMDIGTLEKSKKLSVILMELAKGSYEGLFRARNFENDEEIGEEIAKLLVPLVDFHKVGIHLDLRLANYVVVTEDPTNNNKEIIKLIDFGASTAFKKDDLLSKNAKELANLPIRPFWTLRWDEISGPEYEDKDHVQVTTKTDIWNLGIIIVELILLQPKMGLPLVEKQKERWELLGKLAELYRGYKWVEGNEIAYKDVKQQVPHRLVHDTKWLLDYADAILVILEVRKDLPWSFLLITNMFQKEGVIRMSAFGALNFWAKNCSPQMKRNADGELPLFGGLTVEKLLKMANEAIKEERERGNENEIQILHKIGKHLKDEQAKVAVENILKESEKTNQICEH